MNRRDSRPLVYPPVVITHIAKDIADLYAPKAKGKSLIEVHYSAQLNGHPHLGTMTSLATAFAGGGYLSDAFGIPAVVKFEALENAPAVQKKVGGSTYHRTFWDVYEGDRPRAEVYMASFRQLLDYFSQNSGVAYEVLYYKDFQELPFVRRTLLEILDRQDDFVPFIAPTEKYLRIRFPCPVCSFAEKTAKRTVVVERGGKHDVTLGSFCFTHGEHSIRLTPDNKTFVDFNTSIRNVIKEAKFIEDARALNALNLMVDGSDWVGMAFQVANSLDLLGYRYRDMACRLFTPLIEDWSGAKFSKSVYVARGTYSDLPSEFLSYEAFERSFGLAGLAKVWNEALSWVSDPKKLFRNYSVEYLRRIFLL